MTEKIDPDSIGVDEEISVNLVYDAQARKVLPWAIKWRGRTYKVDKVGLHHFSRAGNTLFHYFSVTCQNTFFRLVFNTQNLHWKLEEIGSI